MAERIDWIRSFFSLEAATEYLESFGFYVEQDWEVRDEELGLQYILVYDANLPCDEQRNPVCQIAYSERDGGCMLDLIDMKYHKFEKDSHNE